MYRDSVPEVPERDPTEDVTILIKLYILADRLQDLESANMIMDALVRCSDYHDDVPKAEICTLAYETTPPGSPLRKLMVDWWAHDMPDRLVEADEQIPRDMLVDIAREFGMIAIKRGKRAMAVAPCRVSKRARCYYNQHDDEHQACEG